jgi:endoglucanase
MQRFVACGLVVGAVMVGCGGTQGSTGPGNLGGSVSVGGTKGAGGSLAVGGGPSAGGTQAGGSVATGGLTSSGDSSAVAFTGGSAATGGAASTGGATSAGATTGGNVGTGGTKPSGGGTASAASAVSGGTGPTGGKSATGGVLATGGAKPTGGNTATGASAGTGGTRPMGGSAPTGGSAATGGTSGADAVDAATMATAMGFGTNIGNTLENTTSWETGWGQPLISQAYINGMASRGIKTVRVPVAWDTYAVSGVIDSAKMNRVKEVVSWIEAAGMYSVVNIHWDGGWIYNENNSNKYKLTDDVKTKFASYWTQIATAFSTVGHKLIFEGLNEEGNFWVNGDSNGTPDYAALNSLNQLFVTTVRAQAGYSKTRALLIAGFTTDIDKTCVDAFTVPNDPAGQGKLFLSIHYYTPYTFCGLDTVESWGSPQTTWGTDAEKTTLTNLFTKLATFSTQKKIPVILGEFGVTRGTNYPRDSASRILWMESVFDAALSRNMVPLLWDTGSEIGRVDGSFSTELQTVMNGVKQ